MGCQVAQSQAAMAGSRLYPSGSRPRMAAPLVPLDNVPFLKRKVGDILPGVLFNASHKLTAYRSTVLLGKW